MINLQEIVFNSFYKFEYKQKKRSKNKLVTAFVSIKETQLFLTVFLFVFIIKFGLMRFQIDHSALNKCMSQFIGSHI